MSGAPQPGQHGRAGIAVGLCTYRRLPGLLRALEHIAVAIRDLDVPPVVIIIDNDGDDPMVAAGVAVFAQRSGLEIVFRIERRPGISEARNALFAAADGLDIRFLAMLDDDEWPSRSWLSALMRVQAETGAAIVGGPARPYFPETAAWLRRHSRYWSVDRQFRHGRPFVFCSCNCMIELEALARISRPLFAADFGLSGGGDTVFFRRLFLAGLPMAWAEDAAVYEAVPPERATLGWIRRRRFRVGNQSVRWERLEDRGWRPVLKTLALTARLVIYPLLRREPESSLLGWCLEADKVRGRYAAHFGTIVFAYARPERDEPGRLCRDEPHGG